MVIAHKQDKQRILAVSKEADNEAFMPTAKVMGVLVKILKMLDFRIQFSNSIFIVVINETNVVLSSILVKL